MGIFNFDSVRNIERIILKWIWIRRYRVPLFILVVVLLLGFSHAPYVNLFFNAYLIFFVSAILAPFILDIDDRPIFATATLFLIIASMVWFSDRDVAEMMVNYVFIILFSGVTKALFSSGKI